MKGFVGRTATFAVALVTLMAFWAASAQATYPGQNGKLAFTNGIDLATVNLDGSGLAVVSEWAYDPAWSPDGTKIAFAHAPSHHGDIGPTDIYVTAADGSSRTRLTDDPGFDFSPTWSPDGSRIAFISERDGFSRDIYLMDADGREVQRLTSDHLLIERLEWSPDGSRLLFHDDFANAWWVMNPDGSGQHVISPETGGGGPPFDAGLNWSPDGARIAFHRGTGTGDNNIELWTMDPDGTGRTQLPVTVAVNHSPAWSPDGRLIAFNRCDSVACNYTSRINLFDTTTLSQSVVPSPPVRPEDIDWQPRPFENASKKCKAFPGEYRNHGQCVSSSK